VTIVKKDGYGVYKVEEFWWFRHYQKDHIPKGPYETRERAMEDLLACLGFDVEGSVTQHQRGSK
jgi:hypothetical protein